MNKVLFEGLSFDDVLLIPQKSSVLPNEVDLRTHLARDIYLNIPFVSAGMDTVTEWEFAAAIAREGGLGFIHKSMSIEDQAAQISRAKSASYEGFPRACLDDSGRLRVGAAVGATKDVIERTSALVAAGVDIIAIDTAHGHSQNVINTVRKVREAFPDLAIVAGNICMPGAVDELADAGADCVKVGMGPGAICTTRIVAGIGNPQITAVMMCSEEAEKKGVTVIADGGIKYSGDIVKAIAAGANAVMMGGMFAGCDECPGDVIEKNGKKFKTYRGMGSTDAMKVSGGDRYFQSGTKKFVPEGISGLVPYKGKLSDVVYQMLGGLRSGMGYCGTATIDDLRRDGRFVKISAAGLRESHPHDMAAITDEPNYHRD
ncbi:MAG: IMP dehydrogenase [Oscillospiraceae bacterium]|jgi:IMP dehydrogenase